MCYQINSLKQRKMKHILAFNLVHSTCSMAEIDGDKYDIEKQRNRTWPQHIQYGTQNSYTCSLIGTLLKSFLGQGEIQTK